MEQPIAITLDAKQLKMLRSLLSFHNDEDDICDNLQCTEQEWADLLAKFMGNSV